MTGLYLKETAKLFDIVDLTICCSLYKICNGNQFEHMKGTDFVDFMNLKEVSRPVVVRHRENSRVCYLLYVVSKEIMNESLAKEWIQHMLEQCKISPGYYKSHYRDALNSETGETNAQFVKAIEKAIEKAKSVK